MNTAWRKAVVLLGICLLLSLLPGCSSPSKPAQAGNPFARETLTQVSTINALMAGLYDGVISCGQLKEYGDFGVGTFDALDGEMVVLDGQVYQVKADGVAYRAPDSLGVPFAAVTFFDQDIETAVAPGTDYAGLPALVDSAVFSQNIFYAVKLTGTFRYVRTRSVPRQEKPYPVLADVTPKQSVFEFNDVSGTVVGFWCPQYVNGINVPGFHLHFLTADGQAGGHLLDFRVAQAQLSIDFTGNFFMVLPDEDSDFHQLDLSQDKQSELEKVEK